jgi:hypothetical protein
MEKATENARRAAVMIARAAEIAELGDRADRVDLR